jgi:hypothetical protein
MMISKIRTILNLKPLTKGFSKISSLCRRGEPKRLPFPSLFISSYIVLPFSLWSEMVNQAVWDQWKKSLNVYTIGIM